MTHLLLSILLLFGQYSEQSRGSSALASTVIHGYVHLTWTASLQSTGTDPGTVIIYRAVGACPGDGTIGSLTYVQLTAAALAAGPYDDRTVAAATTYCYYTTALIDGTESPTPSNTTAATLP